MNLGNSHWWFVAPWEENQTSLPPDGDAEPSALSAQPRSTAPTLRDSETSPPTAESQGKPHTRAHAPGGQWKSTAGGLPGLAQTREPVQKGLERQGTQGQTTRRTKQEETCGMKVAPTPPPPPEGPLFTRNRSEADPERSPRLSSHGQKKVVVTKHTEQSQKTQPANVEYEKCFRTGTSQRPQQASGGRKGKGPHLASHSTDLPDECYVRTVSGSWLKANQLENYIFLGNLGEWT